MYMIEIMREWESLYEGRFVLHIPFGDCKTYPFSDAPNPSERKGRPAGRDVYQVVRRDREAEAGMRLIDKQTMRVIPKDEEASWRNDPNCNIHPDRPSSNNPPYLRPSLRGVRIKGRKINNEWGEILVLVDGNPIAIFPHSTNPDEWDGRITSKRDAMESARAVAKAERDKPQETGKVDRLQGPRSFHDDLKEREFRRFKSQTDELLSRQGIRTTGSSICGPDDTSKEPEAK